MPRYTIQLTHVPGYGMDRDHLGPVFVECLLHCLQPSYASRAGAKKALRRFWKRAAQTADFYGKVTYHILEK